MEREREDHGKKTSKWLKAICIAKFDQELGMVIERVMPPHALSDAGIQSLAMLALPESNCAEAEWQHTYFFKFRHTPGPAFDPESDDDFLFGYAHYLQRPEPRLPRGSYQKSLVLVSPFYSPRQYTEWALFMGKAYFATRDKDILQVAQFV
jgi:hypothetical protein